MAVTALSLVYGHGVICRMTSDAEGGVEDMAQTRCRMILIEWVVWSGHVSVAVQAIDRSLVGIGDDLRHGGAGGRGRVSVAGGVMADRAGSVERQNLGHGAD